MTDIDSQLALVPASLQTFLRPIFKTDERVAVWGQNFIKPVDLGQEYCHTKGGLPYNLWLGTKQQLAKIHCSAVNLGTVVTKMHPYP